MIRIDVSGWMFLLVPAHLGSPGQRAVKTVIVLVTRQHTQSVLQLSGLCPGLTGWAGTRKVKPIWIVLKLETVSVSGISWAICKSAPRPRQITMPFIAVSPVGSPIYYLGYIHQEVPHCLIVFLFYMVNLHRSDGFNKATKTWWHCYCLHLGPYFLWTFNTFLSVRKTRF